MTAKSGKWPGTQKRVLRNVEFAHGRDTGLHLQNPVYEIGTVRGAG